MSKYKGIPLSLRKGRVLKESPEDKEKVRQEIREKMTFYQEGVRVLAPQNLAPLNPARVNSLLFSGRKRKTCIRDD